MDSSATGSSNSSAKLEPGCYIGSHMGIYAIPSVITLAQSFGFIVDPFAQYALDDYYEHHREEEYPAEAITELSDEAIEWLNVGDNSGLDRPIKGQNQPPVIPDGYAWGWNDGDFGLYSTTDEEPCGDHGFEVCPDCGNTGVTIGSNGYRDCTRFLTCWTDPDPSEIN